LSDTRTPTDNTVTSAKIVDGTIVNADVAAAAAIARSKLDFGGGLVNADIAAAAAIAYSKLNLSASILSADIVDGTLVDADVAAAADIAGTKIKPAARTSLTRPTNVNAVGHCSARLDLKDVVRLEGGVVNNTGGTIAAGGLVATVPAGFRPASQAHAIVPINGYPQHMTIATDGSLRFPTASTLNGEEVDFDGVTFTTT
jgi:hypothetical protein